MTPRKALEWVVLVMGTFTVGILIILSLFWIGHRMLDDRPQACGQAHDERIRDRLVVRCDQYLPEKS